MNNFNQKGIIQIVPLFILLLGITIGVWLVQHKTNLFPKAQEANYIQTVDQNGNQITETTDPNVYLKIVLPPDWQLPTEKTSGLVKEVFAQSSCPLNDPSHPNEDFVANCDLGQLAQLPNDRLITFSSAILTQMLTSRLQDFSNNDLIKIGQASGDLPGFLNRFSNDRLASFDLSYLKQLPTSRQQTFPCNIQTQLGLSCGETSTPNMPTSAPQPPAAENPTKHILQELFIENKDTDGSSGGHESFQITSNFNDYLNKAVYWKLNELKPDQTTATRVVQLTLFDGTNYVPFVATITLTRPSSPPSTGQIQFPRDEGQHNTNMEWWYLNFYNLESYGRAGVIAVARVGPPNNSVDVLLFESINLMVDDVVNDHIFVGKLKTSTDKLDLEFQGKDTDPYDDKGNPVHFKLSRDNSGDISQAKYHLSLKVTLSQRKELTMERTLQNFQKPLLEGGQGYLPIASGIYSFYYSLTDLRTNQGAKDRVWMDHQWFDISNAQIPHLQQKIENVRGFLPSHEWFNLQLKDGTNLVFWKIYVSGEIVLSENMDLQTPGGEQINLPHFQITDRTYFPYGGQLWPQTWTIQEPTQKINLRLTTIFHPSIIRGVFYEWPIIVLQDSQIGDRNVIGSGFAEVTHTIETP